MLPNKGLWVFACLVSGAVACAATSWPDEPGIPVALTHAENLNAAESFLTALTARRKTANLSAPLVTPAYQSGIRVIAEDLQAGKVSAKQALASIETWGKDDLRPRGRRLDPGLLGAGPDQAAEQPRGT